MAVPKDPENLKGKAVKESCESHSLTAIHIYDPNQIPYPEFSSLLDLVSAGARGTALTYPAAFQIYKFWPGLFCLLLNNYTNNTNCTVNRHAGSTNMWKKFQLRKFINPYLIVQERIPDWLCYMYMVHYKQYNFKRACLKKIVKIIPIN